MLAEITLMANNQFQSRQRSALGQACIRSALGQACTKNVVSKFLSTGVATAGMVISVRAHIASWTASATRNDRVDFPSYNTYFSDGDAGATGASSQIFGKTISEHTGNYQIHRFRLGLPFTMPNLTGLKAAFLHIAFNTYLNSLESCVPTIYASSTDDSAFGAGWQNNLDHFAGSGIYGLSGDQLIELNVSSIIGRSNAKLSLIIGQDLELGSSGAGTVPSGTTQKSGFSWDKTSVASPTIDLYY
jgi:hypothetical protein